MRPLTAGVDNKTSPTWSPDGDQVLYQREYFLGHDLDIWLFTLSQGTDRPALNRDWNEESPSWGTAVAPPNDSPGPAS